MIEAIIIYPRTTKNSSDDNMQPCLTPLPTTNSAERIPLFSARHLAPLYVDLMADTNLLGIPLLLSAIQRPSLSTLSKAFFKVYKNQVQIGTVFSTLLDDYPQRVKVVNARRSRSLR